MRSRPAPTALAFAALATLAFGHALPVQAADTPTALRISELLPNPDAAQSQREFIELWNPTGAGIDLAGWTLRDAATASGATNEFTFPSGRLAPGARIAVWSNGTGDARGPSWSSSASKAVWNDAGDAATLLDPLGAVVDWLAYGSSAAAAPAGFEGQPKPPAPSRGLSIALDGAAWKTGAPTPALAPGAVGGLATATVLNVAPDARLTGVPVAAKPGEAVRVGLAASDGNGVADLAGWTLSAGGATVASGEGLPTAAVDLAAPGSSGPWTIVLTVTDQAGLVDLATATVQVRDARLSVSLPSGALRFPDLRPGDVQVAATDWASLRNEGSDAVTPLLDVSPFTGPAGDIPVDGNLEVGLRPAGGNATWIAYAGPLTPLPTVLPGVSLEVSLRLRAVPTPLAAGAYGTTFAVVAA